MRCRYHITKAYHNGGTNFLFRSICPEECCEHAVSHNVVWGIDINITLSHFLPLVTYIRSLNSSYEVSNTITLPY
jgi:hypothetical protein